MQRLPKHELLACEGCLHRPDRSVQHGRQATRMHTEGHRGSAIGAVFGRAQNGRIGMFVEARRFAGGRVGTADEHAQQDAASKMPASAAIEPARRDLCERLLGDLLEGRQLHVTRDMVAFVAE